MTAPVALHSPMAEGWAIRDPAPITPMPTGADLTASGTGRRSSATCHFDNQTATQIVPGSDMRADPFQGSGESRDDDHGSLTCSTRGLQSCVLRDAVTSIGEDPVLHWRQQATACGRAMMCSQAAKNSRQKHIIEIHTNLWFGPSSKGVSASWYEPACLVRSRALQGSPSAQSLDRPHQKRSSQCPSALELLLPPGSGGW